MSVKIMGQVFDVDLPTREKFVLLAMADHADHDGSGVYPGNKRLADKTGYTERTVARAIDELKKKGYVQKESGPKPQKGRATEWRIIPESVTGETLTGENATGTTPVRDSGDTPVRDSPQPSLKENRNDNRNGDDAPTRERNDGGSLDDMDWLLDLWAEQQSHEPTESEKEQQSKWAVDLLESYERDALEEALKGMNQMYKFQDQGWTLNKVIKNFSEARGAYNSDGGDGYESPSNAFTGGSDKSTDPQEYAQ